MAPRGAFDHSLQVRQPFLSLVFQKIPGESSWTLLNQGKTFSPDVNADVKDFRRIGDKRVTSIPGAAKTTVTFQVYLDDDVSELARALGEVKPGGGWTGSEEIDLDPDFVADYKIENYDGSDPGAALLFTEYINEFRGNKLTPSLGADDDSRMADVSGTAYSYYIIPEAD